MEPTRKREKKFNQYLASIVANIAGISWGNSIGWSSPAIAKMTAEDLSDSPLDFIPSSDELSWIGSILTIGGLVGAIFFAPLPGVFGRKWSLLMCSLPFIASFLTLIFTHDVISIYVARFLQGFGSGAVMVVVPMYVGEISSANCRGTVSSFIQIELVVGILYAYCVGPYVSYWMFQWLCLLIPVIFIITFMFMPDTPHFFIMKGNREAAVKSLKFFRGLSAEDVAEEMDEIEETVIESMKLKSGFTELFKGRANLIALTIVVGLICFQNFSGIDAVLFYGETIFSKAGSSLDPAVATILIGLTMLIASTISSLFVDRAGRIILLYISAVGMTISLTVMGIYFFFDEREQMGDFGWLPVTSLIGFIIFYCVGFGPLPFTMLAEMLSPEIKSIACSIAVSACWIVDFGVTKAFLPLEHVIGNFGNFWLFAGFCVLALVFSATIVFETKGLTLNEIQDRLNRKVKK